MFASFEDVPGAGTTAAPVGSGYNYITYGAGAVLDGWTVLGKGVDVITAPSYSPTPFPDLNHAVDLNALDTGGLRQSFTGLANGVYNLTFALAGNSVTSTGFPGGAVNPLDLQIDVLSGTTHYSEDFTASSWNTFSVPVNVQDGSATITFQSQNGGTNGPTIDAIGLAPVPLPASFQSGAALLGLAALGKLIQLTKRKQTLA